MIETFNDITPRISPSAFVHPLALVRGDAQIGELSIVHAGAVVNADLAPIRIGNRVMIEDNCVIHTGLYEDWRRAVRTPLVIGDDVVLGHGAIVHGRRIGDRVMVGMNATVLGNAEIGNNCVIAKLIRSFSVTGSTYLICELCYWTIDEQFVLRTPAAPLILRVGGLHAHPNKTLGFVTHCFLPIIC